MLRTIDTKFRFVTHKFINFLSKTMVLIFFCILISMSAKYFARNILKFIESKNRKINVVFNLKNIEFDSKSFKKTTKANWFKLIKFNQRNELKFDIFISDSLDEVESFSKLNNFQILDTELLNNTLKNNSQWNEGKIKLNELRDFIILELQNDKKIYIGINKNTKFISLDYEIIFNLIKFWYS